MDNKVIVCSKLLKAIQSLINLRQYQPPSTSFISFDEIDDLKKVRQETIELCEIAQESAWEFYEYAQSYNKMDEYPNIWISYNFMKNLAENPQDVSSDEIEWWQNEIMPQLKNK